MDRFSVVVKKLSSRRELEIMQELRSKREANIVEIEALIREETPQPVIVMHWQWPIDFLKSNSEQTISSAYQLIDAVAFMHSQLICHLDIKPSNLLMEIGNREIVIIDFGLAKRLASKEATLKGGRGTPGWVAPELCLLGAPADWRDTVSSDQDYMDHNAVFSPILADTWAVGRVIEWLVEKCSDEGQRLRGLDKTAYYLSQNEPPSRITLDKALVDIDNLKMGGAQSDPTGQSGPEN
jgi:serine/threonine protein kinase